MEANYDTPGTRKYPQRTRTKVKYYEEFECSLEETPKSKKLPKVDDSYNESGEEKENDGTNEFEEDDEDEEVMSEYDKLRLKNLEENRRMMIELGLIDPKKEKKEKPRIPRAKPKEKSTKLLEPTKRSLRLLKKTPEGKNMSFDIFQESPSDTPTIAEERTRIKEEELPMSEDGETTDFLDSLKASISQDSGISSQGATDSLISDMRRLEFAAINKVTQSRVQSMCVHPLESKLLIAVGSTQGTLGLWNVSEGSVVKFEPHLRPINCISASATDQTKLLTTSFDGTVRRADINKSVFDLVYQTDEKRNMCHVTWHSQIDNDTLLVAHGSGEAGIIDMRAKKAQRWFHCHPRSIRTTHLHPTQPHYFITASGIGECKIWDLRGKQKHIDECVSELKGTQSGKGLTSGFFSPDGNKVVLTCNDDFIRIYDTSDVADPKELHRVMHDNHTGRWLSVFKAVWHTHSSDLFFTGSMLHPRRIQMYSGSGRLIKELTDEQLTTIVPVIALHPSLPVVVGGNGSGKAHVFTTASLHSSLVKEEKDEFV